VLDDNIQHALNSEYIPAKSRLPQSKSNWIYVETLYQRDKQRWGVDLASRYNKTCETLKSKSDEMKKLSLIE
jgi:hypothetical protein